MGSSRAAQEAKEISEAAVQSKNVVRKKRELESKLKSLDAQITSLSSQFEAEKRSLISSAPRMRSGLRRRPGTEVRWPE